MRFHPGTLCIRSANIAKYKHIIIYKIRPAIGEGCKDAKVFHEASPVAIFDADAKVKAGLRQEGTRTICRFCRCFGATSNAKGALGNVVDLFRVLHAIALQARAILEKFQEELLRQFELACIVPPRFLRSE